MCLDKNILFTIINGNKRFIDPFEDSEGYFILDSRDVQNVYGAVEIYNAKNIELYYDKLRYAVCNADSLIKDAFDDNFYDFYGVNKNQVESSAQMYSGLYFDSFALDIKDNSACAYLSNDQFMFGHFVEVLWDNNWNRIYAWIN